MALDSIEHSFLKQLSTQIQISGSYIHCLHIAVCPFYVSMQAITEKPKHDPFILYFSLPTFSTSLLGLTWFQYSRSEWFWKVIGMSVIALTMKLTSDTLLKLVRQLKGERDSERDCLEPELSEIRVFSYNDAIIGRTVTLVEAPGFDHVNEDITDTAILNQINLFLRNK